MIREELCRYLRRLGQDSSLEKANAPRGVPMFVSANNEWWMMKVGSEVFLLAISKVAELSPDDVIAQWNGISGICEKVILVIPARDDAYCACLDAKGISYIMPGARLNVPGRMMLVTRHIKTVSSPKDRMSIHAQMVILWHLLKAKGKSDAFPDVLSGTGLDKSHLSRAASELERLGLAQIDRSWRAHALVFDTERSDLWKRSAPMMVSPVMRKIHLAEVPVGLPSAGIEALSERTMLAPDGEATYAVRRGDSRIDESKDTKYSGSIVEIWRYDPLLFSKDGLSIDSLSLWLSLRDETDPRVRIEMNSMIEALKW